LGNSFQKYRQEGFLGRWVQRKNYSWPEGRKKLDHTALERSKPILKGTFKNITPLTGVLEKLTFG
jgi:hypothetical protein